MFVELAHGLVVEDKLLAAVKHFNYEKTCWRSASSTTCATPDWRSGRRNKDAHWRGAFTALAGPQRGDEDIAKPVR